MKRIIVVFNILFVFMFVLTGCVTSNESDKLKVVVVINTNLGDNAFSDLVWGGVLRAAEDFDFDASVIELGGDPTRQEPTLTELAEDGEYDVIVVGTNSIFLAAEKVVRAFPDQKFILYDVKLDFTVAPYLNAVSVLSMQNEGSFLGGVMAALLTTKQGDPRINPSNKIIGLVAGGENTTINDFLVGYIAGAKAVDPEVRILFSYVGNFQDAGAAQELALAQYSAGADIVYAVAGGASAGVYQAALIAGRYALGVDLDRALQYEKDGNLAQAEAIVSSVLKNLDVLIYNRLGEFVNGTIEWGTHQSAGVALNGMVLSKNKFYTEFVPLESRNIVDQFEARIVSGEIVIPTAFGLSPEEINAFKARAGRTN